jgi:cytochrome c-type biogenesis protein CcmH/NrfG
MTRFIIIAAAAALAWCLSGYDSLVTGENIRADLIRRGLRCGGTLLLLIIGSINPGFMIFMFVAIAVLWASCLSEIFARAFHVFVDQPDNREFDPKEATRGLSQLAALVRDGRHEEAIGLGRRLVGVTGVSAAAMETMLFDLYHEKFGDHRIARIASLADALRLRSERRFDEAIARLESLRRKDPGNLGATLLMMRIYTQDLSRLDEAFALAHSLEREPQAPPAFADYARHCIGEWSGALPRRQKSTEGVESLFVEQCPAAPAAPVDVNVASIDELLASGHLATAIEILEGRIRAQPDDFDSWLKLAEAHGAYCCNRGRAAKIVAKISRNSAFTHEQVQLAKAKLDEWRDRVVT